MKRPGVAVSLRFLVGVLVLLWGTRGAADARRIPWDGFLGPVKRICLVQVVAAKELLEERPQPIEKPDGSVEIPLRPAQMVSTAETERTVNGACPPLIELRWEAPMGFPVYTLPLNEVGSHFLLFLGEPSAADGGEPRFQISPRYAWPSRYGSTAAGDPVSYFSTQYLAVPDAFYTPHQLRSHFPGGYVVYETRIIEESTALDQLKDIELAADSDEAEARPRHEVEP